MPRPPERLAILGCLLLQASCATLRVPADLPTIQNAIAVNTRVADVQLSATALSGTEQYLELFDDNLPEIGLVAARISLRNESSQLLFVPPTPWSLRIGDRSFKGLDAEMMLKVYYKKRRIRMFTVKTDEAARLGIQRLLFSPRQIPPATQQDGLAFFQLDVAHAARWPAGAALISGMLRFADGREISLDLHFPNAAP